MAFKNQYQCICLALIFMDNNEKEKRFNIFKENLAPIDSFNITNEKTYKLGVNQFADLTNEEFTASRNRFKGHVCSNTVITFKYENVTALPSTVDWRKKGAVIPIKDQGQCGKLNFMISNEYQNVQGFWFLKF
ncbi:hypothetical protein COLO4_33686 [Corchorus olitorius]|uniref:Cathepsin propeptide inhibitor domain-containing protein n=1 Tax=Corchorus olitorius TaxID=93759 RepID=A0A1R3GS70_9ROSI|nr:hypothetical protein COLO4_33686 [Corchorus olitorius]